METALQQLITGDCGGLISIDQLLGQREFPLALSEECLKDRDAILPIWFAGHTHHSVRPPKQVSVHFETLADHHLLSGLKVRAKFAG